MIQLSNYLSAIHPSLGSLSGIPLLVFLIVMAIFTVFLGTYLVRSGQIGSQLSRAASAIRRLQTDTHAPSPDHVARIFLREPMMHLWKEYADTLHVVTKAVSQDGIALKEVRATVPAESYFTREALVDNRLSEELVRNLPGVLTGLGIIGTFFGLLDGLQQFDPSSTAKAVEGLGPLLAGVEHAFAASVAAIGCAMAVVVISRMALTMLYRRVESLTTAIDSLYSTGAGEEYLARLVKSSEQSAASSAQLKDALVEDLRTLMTNLVERQIAAQQSSTAALANQIGETISHALSEPLSRVTQAMEVTTKGNGEQVGTMLESLLTAFMTRLEDTFGGQIRGINDQMQRSMDSMTTVQAALQHLVADIRQAGEQSVHRMSDTLEEAIKRSSDHQQLLTDQMRDFVNEFRRLAAEEQGRSRQVMEESVARVLGELTSALGNLESFRAAAAAEEGVRSERLSAQASQLVGGLSGQVETLLGAISRQVEQTQTNIDAVAKISLRAIDGMNQGAVAIDAASRRFEAAGNGVTNVLERSRSVTEALQSSAVSLQGASGVIRQSMEQYELTRAAVNGHLAALTGLIEAAKSEAGVSQDLVSSIRASADAMRAAETQSREHLDQVNEALTNAFSEFGNSLLNQVRNAIAETDRHLAEGQGHLTGVVQELESVVNRMKRIAA